MTDKAETIKELLYELEEPIVFKNILNAEGSDKWELLEWSLEDLAEKLENQKLPFRTGKNLQTKHPQWEVDAPIERKSLKEFLNEVQENNDPSKWSYFDYKYMKEWFKEKPDILGSFNWRQFGFDLDGSDSTMWIGSKGAHTNCHQDTYGCNLIAQIHGKKLWLLISPKCTSHMKPTRVSYEESTIFSKHNFFTPSNNELQAIKSMSGHVKMITLEPRDVLFVPKGWWHYVESLETSMSVNVWLPVEEDCESRLKETLVHLIVNTVGEDVVLKTVNQQDSNLLESIGLIESSLDECKEFNKNTDLAKSQKSSKTSDVTSIMERLNLKYRNRCHMVPNLTKENLNLFTSKNDIDLVNDDETKDAFQSKPSTLDILEAVVDAFCHPEVISNVSQILKNKFIEKT